MKDIDQVRRANMIVLEREAGGPTAAAARLGWSQAQWSNLRAGALDSKTGKSRGMRKETARKIEAAFKRPAHWLDAEHGAEADAPAKAPALTPRQQALLGLFEGLTGSQQEDFMRELEAQKQQNDALLKELLQRRAGQGG